MILKTNNGVAIIEFDGEQHEKPVTFGNWTYEQAKKRYVTLLQNDKIKNDFCKKQNYPLLRIHWKCDDINDKILNFCYDNNIKFYK